MPRGYFCLVLHAHLPFVRHPEYEDPLEENWLFEAITETYLPLLDVMEGWRRDGLPFRLAISLSPTLMAMLSDPLLQERYERRLAAMIELADKEIMRTRWLKEFAPLTKMYRRRFTDCLAAFRATPDRNLVRRFESFQQSGHVELLTSGATHGFLPLMQHQPWAARAQVAVAAQDYLERFGSRSRGLWLSECGYYPGVDQLLADSGIEYFFIDAHGVLLGDPRPGRGTFAPVVCPSGVAAFPRDLASSRIVWSAIEGYPGDAAYREYYRDVGFDLDFDYLAPYIHSTGVRIATGLKYYRISGREALGDKAPYDPELARRRAHFHAEDFLAGRRHQVQEAAALMPERPPLIVSPYDAELFGHWWYEGPIFLDHLMRELCAAPEWIEPITPSEYLARHPDNQHLTPSYSSWGNKGYAEVWLNSTNDWIYPRLHEAAERLCVAAQKYRDTDDPLTRRALKQMGRELLLAQSSDWAFIMNMRTMVEYATARTVEHLENFNRLWSQLRAGEIDAPALAELESSHNIFPNLSFEIFAPDE